MQPTSGHKKVIRCLLTVSRALSLPLPLSPHFLPRPLSTFPHYFISLFSLAQKVPATTPAAYEGKQTCCLSVAATFDAFHSFFFSFRSALSGCSLCLPIRAVAINRSVCCQQNKSFAWQFPLSSSRHISMCIINII